MRSKRRMMMGRNTGMMMGRNTGMMMGRNTGMVMIIFDFYAIIIIIKI